MSILTKKDIDHYLYLLAKEYKKLNKHNPDAELILIGGSSILLNYGFRDTTTDIDSIFKATSTIKEIINKIADEYNLENDWLNDDFTKTGSYSPKLPEYSKPYKTFCQCLHVRTIKDEYLLAMKLRSSRIYKHDISDIIGIINECYEKEYPLDYTTISKAYSNLYGELEEIPETNRTLLNNLLNCKDYEELYYSTVKWEEENKKLLTDAEKKYGNIFTEDNIKNFLSTKRNKDNSINNTDRFLFVDEEKNQNHSSDPKPPGA